MIQCFMEQIRQETDRVEYMKWNRADQSFDFNAPIDNTNIAVLGNIVDTTVSDERLKTKIQDVESNYCDCVKNVKIKTFEYKDEKYKDSDKYGFIAQHLQKHLPKEFDNIVKETKPKKDEGEAYLTHQLYETYRWCYGVLFRRH